jgi:hypothetical protein
MVRPPSRDRSRHRASAPTGDQERHDQAPGRGPALDQRGERGHADGGVPERLRQPARGRQAHAQAVNDPGPTSMATPRDGPAP